MSWGRLALWASLWIALAAPSQAHGLTDAASRLSWNFDPWITTPLMGAATLYAYGAMRLRLAGRGWHRRGAAQVVSFALAWFFLAAALLSPLHWLGEHVFTFHMIEHEIVMAIAAPLFVLARPAGAFLWAFPKSLRHRIGSAFLLPLVNGAWRWLTRPRTATVMHGAAIWIWHVPGLFDAALADVTLHRLQHLSFFLTASLFWWAVLRRTGSGVPVWHLFVTMVHTSVLGAWIALAPRVLFHVQTADAPAFGLTPLEDQQLAGVIMWVPAETVYAGAALVMAALWIRRSRGSTKSPGTDRALAT